MTGHDDQLMESSLAEPILDFIPKRFGCYVRRERDHELLPKQDKGRKRQLDFVVGKDRACQELKFVLETKFLRVARNRRVQPYHLCNDMIRLALLSMKVDAYLLIAGPAPNEKGKFFLSCDVEDRQNRSNIYRSFFGQGE